MKKTIFTLLSLINIVYAQNQLQIPATLSGSEINLAIQNGIVEFYEGFETNTIGYNGNLLGPTLILNKDEFVRINVTNNLDEPTTVHWHGLHVAPENDGGPHTVIESNTIWSPSFTVKDNAATYWYHPHLHEKTEEHVTYGAAGFIIVRDEEEAQLDLPRTYGVDDIPVVIQSRAFNSEKQLQVGTAMDNVILCNGTIDSYIDLPAQVVRLRLLNGSTERVYYLGLEDNTTLYQIASDGGLLDSPVALTRLRLVPGERAEILLDLTNMQDQSINLKSFASELENGIYGASNPSSMPMGSIPDYSNNELNGNDFNILQINIIESTENSIIEIPVPLTTNNPYTESNSSYTRSLLFSPAQMGPSAMLTGPFVINNESFDMDIINFYIGLGSVEIWKLTNQSAIAHPFHIHDVQFYILDINGSQPPDNMLGRKDVVMVSSMGSVRFITKFEDFSNPDVPYMYHCHMLSHEDEGMMGQFIVAGSSSNVESNSHNDLNVSIYPNPVSEVLYIKNISEYENVNISIYSWLGKEISRKYNLEKNEKYHLNMEDFSSGLYFIKTYNLEKTNYQSFIIE